MKQHKSVVAVIQALVVSVVVSGCATSHVLRVPEGELHELHEHLGPVEKADLALMLSRHAAYNYYVTPAIPPKKLSDARRSCMVPEEEDVLALLDVISLLGSAKKHALLIGSSGIYMHNDWACCTPGRHFVTYSDLVDIPLGIGDSYEVTIGGLCFNTAGSSMKRSDVLALLRDVQAFIDSVTARKELPKEHKPDRTLGEKLRELKELRDEGILSNDEYERMKQSVIGKPYP